jgi:organic radical activating enzyme
MKEITSFSSKGIIKDHNFLIFELLITEICNMHCSYCYMRNDSETWGKFSSTKEVLRVIDELAKIPHPVSICLSGGECTLHYKFVYIVEYIQKYIDKGKIKDLHINTNLQLSTEKLQEIHNINPNIVYHISWHIDTLKDAYFFEKLLIVNYVELNIMIHPNKKYLNDIVNMKNFAEKYNINYNIKPVYINSKFKSNDYILNTMKLNNTKEYIDNNGVEWNDYDLYTHNMLPMDTYGWECYYIFFTIECRSGNVKQMCSIFEPMNIFTHLDFFINYKLNEPKICPFKNACLWASSLDHYKTKV